MSNQPAPHYVRIKRHKQTIFLHCDLKEDTVQLMKERVEKLTGKPAALQRLLLGKQNLENHSTLWDCGIEKEDEQLLLVLAVQQGDNPNELVWEFPEEAEFGKPEGAAGGPADGLAAQQSASA